MGVAVAEVAGFVCGHCAAEEIEVLDLYRDGQIKLRCRTCLHVWMDGRQ